MSCSPRAASPPAKRLKHHVLEKGVLELAGPLDLAVAGHGKKAPRAFMLWLMNTGRAQQVQTVFDLTLDDGDEEEEEEEGGDA